MKTRTIVRAGIIPAALLIAACGDDVTKVTKIEGTSGMEIVASADSLGKCSAEISGEMKFATKENAVYLCADSAWKNVSKAEKTTCSAETLSDSSGFKIVCDGDSIGVVRNGTDGKDGEKGKAGDACDISDNGDGTVSVVCGDASTILYKAFCGGKLFNPDSNFYVDGKVYKNKTLVWNLMNPKIEYEVFVDNRDGQVYRSVKIGDQTWMAENLNYAYNQKTSSLDSSSFCYNNEPDSCAKYGRFYLWSAAMDSAAIFGDAGKGCGFGDICASALVTTVRGVCPKGWHLPSVTEFDDLLNAVSGKSVAGGNALRSISGWEDYLFDDSGKGTDFFGFSALPAGFRNHSGTFDHAAYTTVFYSSSYEFRSSADCMFLNYEETDLLYGNKNDGYSVRCVRD